jgi:hypothetical protein
MTEQTQTTNPETRTITVTNKDTGSLKILPPGTEKPTLPLTIQIVGESKPRVGTFLMGSTKTGWLCCFKGSGIMPVGQVTFQILD